MLAINSGLSSFQVSCAQSACLYVDTKSKVVLKEQTKPISSRNKQVNQSNVLFHQKYVVDMSSFDQSICIQYSYSNT